MKLSARAFEYSWTTPVIINYKILLIPLYLMRFFSQNYGIHVELALNSSDTNHSLSVFRKCETIYDDDDSECSRYDQRFMLRCVCFFSFRSHPQAKVLSSFHIFIYIQTRMMYRETGMDFLRLSLALHLNVCFVCKQAISIYVFVLFASHQSSDWVEQ